MIIIFCVLVFLVGVLRMQISEFTIAHDTLSRFDNKGQVTLTGVVNNEPDVRDTSQKLEVKIGNSLVLVTTNRTPEYHYLDTVQVTGTLKEPLVYDDFNYKNYLLKDGIYSLMGFPKITLVSETHHYNLFSYLYEKILLAKHRLEQSIQDNFLPPKNLILEGIIFGNNKNITQHLRDQLSNTGLRFLTAISGVHVIILSAIIISLLLFFGIKRNYAFIVSIALIWLYIILTGCTASGVRAAIMGSIFIFAGALGRQNTSSRTIVLAATLMLLQNPLLLMYDIGFQLSFMACLGIIYLKPVVDYFFHTLFGGRWRGMLEIISVTFTAQIFTFPLMVYNFGAIPLVSPATNILIVPVMPWILSFGFLFSIFASLSQFFVPIFYGPCWLLTVYFLSVMNWFSQPWMSKQINNVSWVWIVLAYLAIAGLIWFLHKKYSKNFI